MRIAVQSDGKPKQRASFHVLARDEMIEYTLSEGSTIKKDVAKEYIEEREGNYYVAGTRISLDSIVHAFRRGESPETICHNFELLRLEEVYGAIAYYLANQAEFDAYMIRQNEKWEEGRRKAEALPADFRERLLRARDELHTA